MALNSIKKFSLNYKINLKKKNLINFQCNPISGLGFRRGSYKCVCRRGFYFPDTNFHPKFFNGSTLEEEYEKLMLVSCVYAIFFLEF